MKSRIYIMYNINENIGMDNTASQTNFKKKGRKGFPVKCKVAW